MTPSTNSSKTRRRLNYEHWFLTISEAQKNVAESLMELGCSTHTLNISTPSPTERVITTGCGEITTLFQLSQRRQRLSAAFSDVPLVAVSVELAGPSGALEEFVPRFLKAYGRRILRAGG